MSSKKIFKNAYFLGPSLDSDTLRVKYTWKNNGDLFKVIKRFPIPINSVNMSGFKTVIYEFFGKSLLICFESETVLMKNGPKEKSMKVAEGLWFLEFLNNFIDVESEDLVFKLDLSCYSNRELINSFIDFRLRSDMPKEIFADMFREFEEFSNKK